MRLRNWGIAVGTAAAALTLVAGPAIAEQSAGNGEVSASGDVGVLVNWPFDSCQRRKYANANIFYYDHTDNGVRNYYRVVDRNGNKVGNGWSSCLEG